MTPVNMPRRNIVRIKALPKTIKHMKQVSSCGRLLPNIRKPQHDLFKDVESGPTETPLTRLAQIPQASKFSYLHGFSTPNKVKVKKIEPVIRKPFSSLISQVDDVQEGGGGSLPEVYTMQTLNWNCETSNLNSFLLQD
jgi:hypothetical protein